MPDVTLRGAAGRRPSCWGRRQPGVKSAILDGYLGTSRTSIFKTAATVFFLLPLKTTTVLSTDEDGYIELVQYRVRLTRRQRPDNTSSVSVSQFTF